jgi:hypothetical protein
MPEHLHRREFIQASVAAAAGLITAAGLPRAARAASSTTIDAQVHAYERNHPGRHSGRAGGDDGRPNGGRNGRGRGRRCGAGVAVLHVSLRPELRPRSAGKTEVRVYDIVPTFGAVAVDRAEADGRLFVELNCYSSSGDQCPGFKLEKKPNGLFYTYDRQITSLWNAARAPEVPATKEYPVGRSWSAE